MSGSGGGDVEEGAPAGVRLAADDGVVGVGGFRPGHCRRDRLEASASRGDDTSGSEVSTTSSELGGNWGGATGGARAAREHYVACTVGLPTGARDDSGGERDRRKAPSSLVLKLKTRCLTRPHSGSARRPRDETV